MSDNLLFTVAEAATLIAKVTDQDSFTVAKDISKVAWEAYRLDQPDIIRAYQVNGLYRPWNPEMVYRVVWGEKDQPLKFEENQDNYFLLVKLQDVLAALEYPPEIQAKILAERDGAAQAGAGCGDTSTDAELGKNDTVTMWTLSKPERGDTLAYMIYNALKSAHRAGETKPKARDVMEAIEATKHSDFVEISAGDLKYYDSNGEVQTANVEAIRKRVERMTIE